MSSHVYHYTRNSGRYAPFFLSPAMGRRPFGPLMRAYGPLLGAYGPLLISNNLFSTNFHHHRGWWHHFSTSHLKQQIKTVVLTP